MNADFDSLYIPDDEWEESDNSWSHWLTKQFDSSGFHGMFRRVTFCVFVFLCCVGICLYFSRPKERRALPLSAIGLHELVTQTPSNEEVYRLKARVSKSEYQQYVSRLGLNEDETVAIKDAECWDWEGPGRPSWWQPTAAKESHARVARSSETHARYIDGSVYVVRVTR